MVDPDRDTLIRMAALQHVRRLDETHDHLTAADLKAGFKFEGERIPLINPQRGIFKPKEMRYLLSIRTVFPKPGARVWYDDQRQVHKKIYEGDEAVEYAFMGTNADAAENRWLREAMENRVPVIYFLGVAPGLYKVILPTFVVGWDSKRCSARIAFGQAEGVAYQLSSDEAERRYALRAVKERLHQASFREAVILAVGDG
jgi:putative restriction endonuclease